MKFQFIAEHQRELAVGKMAEMLGISRSGLYAWVGREPSQRAQENKQLLEQIQEIQQRMKYRYGSPRITAELAREGRSVRP